MAKSLSILMLLLNCVSGYGQIYLGKETRIHFFSKTDMKDIEAVNTFANPVMDATTGDIQIKIQNKSFKFESSFMEEHFNENYMESEKFPYTIFKGKITDKINYAKDGDYVVVCKGTMDMHGVTKPVSIPGILKVEGKKITLEAKFKVKPADYNIKVPSLYVKEIAEEIDVDMKSTLMPYVKK